MRYVALVIAGLTAVAVIPLLIYPPASTAPSVSHEEIVAALLFWPTLFVSVALLLFSLTRRPFVTPFGVYLAIFLLSCIFPATLVGGMIAKKIGRDRYLAEENRRVKWLRYDQQLLPHIVQYVRKHPDRVSYPHGDDRAEITGLVSYLRPLAPHIPFGNETIVDPWGDEVTIVMDHDQDLKLQFEEAFYGVYSRTGNEIVVALYCPRVHSLSTSSNEQWQLEGGWIKNP